MLLGGNQKEKIHLNLSSFDAMIHLPITETDLKKIIETLKKSNERELYNKLWTFNIHRKKNDGLS